MNTLFDKIWDAHVVTTVEDVYKRQNERNPYL